MKQQQLGEKYVMQTLGENSQGGRELARTLGHLKDDRKGTDGVEPGPSVKLCGLYETHSPYLVWSDCNANTPLGHSPQQQPLVTVASLSPKHQLMALLICIIAPLFWI